jgi:hypothetical protein
MAEEEPKAKPAVAVRAGDLLEIDCPHCGVTNEAGGRDKPFMFLCRACGKPVEVVDTK